MSFISGALFQYFCSKSCFFLLLLGFKVIAVRIRGEAPQRQNQRNCFVAAKFLVEENDAQDFCNRDEAGDEYAGEQCVDTEDHANCAQEEELPEDRAPHQHHVVLNLTEFEVSCLIRNCLQVVRYFWEFLHNFYYWSVIYMKNVHFFLN